MTITLPGHGRWLVRCLVAVAFAGWLLTPVRSEDHGFEPDVIFRGQSPYVNGIPQSLPSEASLPFRTASSPWIVVSQSTAVPAQSYAAGVPQIAQSPYDPFSQPYSGGMPGLFMDTPAIWQPYVSAQGKFGNERSLGIGQLMMPLYQDGQTLFFADIRGRIDDSSNSEGNAGLAVRSMVDPTWFIGLNGFFDYRRTEFGNNFSQGSIGLEAMSVRYEAKINGYIPEAKTKAANSLSATEFIGNTIFVRGGFERAYYGVDGEIGALLWDDGIGSHELRGFVGGYWFDTNDKSFPSIAGPKGRLEFRSYDLSFFGPESRLTLGVELQHDNVRDFQVSGIARLEIPLGFFQGTRKLSRLERRMLDRIVRDDDIITVAQQGAREVGIDSLTNRRLDNVLVVDKNTANIAAVVAGAANPATSTVVVNGGAGDITANNIVVQGGQVFRGGGFKVIGEDTGAIGTFATRPTINNPSNVIDTVILGNNSSTVADLDLNGGRRGIFGNAALTGTLVSGNTVTGAANRGIEFSTLDATSIIQNNIVQSSGDHGIFLGGVFSGTLKGNIATKNAQNGISVVSLAGTVDNNTASENARFGIGLDNITAAGTISNNTANQNTQGGIAIFPGPVAGKITGNTANNNGRDAAGTLVDATADGFRFDGVITAEISNNSATNNADLGFVFNGALGATGKVTGNSATNNGDFGFGFNSTLDAGSEVTNNIARKNGVDAKGTVVSANVDGFAFLGNVSGKISGNTAENNTQAGYFITNLQGVGEVTNNIATNNPSAGFVFATGVAGTVSGNTATGSTNGYGFDFTTSPAPLGLTAHVMDNVSSNNKGGYGFDTIGLGSTVTGNTAYANGYTAGGVLFNANANGFDIIQPIAGTFTGNTATRNANNGFAKADGGTNDLNFQNSLFGVFSNNVANQNGDQGFRGTNLGTAVNNTGANNTNGGNTFP